MTKLKIIKFKHLVYTEENEYQWFKYVHDHDVQKLLEKQAKLSYAQCKKDILSATKSGKFLTCDACNALVKSSKTKGGICLKCY
jgi:hypothetical protein